MIVYAIIPEPSQCCASFPELLKGIPSFITVYIKLGICCGKQYFHYLEGETRLHRFKLISWLCLTLHNFMPSARSSLYPLTLWDQSEDSFPQNKRLRKIKVECDIVSLVCFGVWIHCNAKIVEKIFKHRWKVCVSNGENRALQRKDMKHNE